MLTLVTRYNITGLYPSAHYQVWVVAMSPFGAGEPSSLINASTEPGGMSCPLREHRVVCFSCLPHYNEMGCESVPMLCTTGTNKVPGLLCCLQIAWFFHYPLPMRLSSSGVGASGNEDLPWDVFTWPTYSYIIVIVG